MDETERLSPWSQNICLLTTLTLDLPPCCMEFCPASQDQDSPAEYFVVGSYNLEREEHEITPAEPELEGRPTESEVSTTKSPKPQSRNGSLILFSIRNEGLKEIQKVQYESGILDLRFLQRVGPRSRIFGIVSSTGAISIFQLHPDADGTHPPTISHLATHQAFAKDAVLTSFAWLPQGEDRLAVPTMAVTVSDGCVYLVSFGDEYQVTNNTIPNFSTYTILNNGEPINKHVPADKFLEGTPIEAWCCHFSPFSGNVLYTGGDDSKLRATIFEKGTTSVQELDATEPSVFSGFDAGVTAILPLPIGKSDTEGLLLIGSYDDTIRLLSMDQIETLRRAGHLPKVLAELNLGGGVWRLKFMEDYNLQPGDVDNVVVRYKVLACCMYAGARILEICRSQSGEWSINVLAEQRIHKSMCYAADLQPLHETPERCLGDLEKRVVVSTSFYDKLLTIWTWDAMVEI